MIQEAISDNNGNKTEAARQLGIQRSLLYKKIRDLHIDSTDVDS